MLHTPIRPLFAAALLFGLALTPLRPADADELSDAYLLPELFEVMATEGRRAVLAEDAAPLSGGIRAQFVQEVEEIYTPTRIEDAFVSVLQEELQDRPDLRADALDFAQSTLGQRVLRLEISARIAMLEDEVDEAARLALVDAREAPSDSAQGQRLALVRERIEANDLVDLNVSLGLNTSYAYYRGLYAEGAVDGLSAEDLLQIVWAQEGEIRAETEDWIEAFFLMAYQPLDDDEFRELIDYAQTPLADRFNQAMFQAFDAVFTDISRSVGQALGRRLQAEEL